MASPNCTTYTIAVKTSDVRNAGTDANVYVQLMGENGAGSQLQLKTSINHRNKFERNHSDVFIFQDQTPLGALKQLKIWHDNTGMGPGWHLKGAEVNDSLGGTSYTFPCNQWLDKTEGDKQLCRLLDCSRSREKVAKHADESDGHQQHESNDQTPQVQPTEAPQFTSPVAKSCGQEVTEQSPPPRRPSVIKNFEFIPTLMVYGTFVFLVHGVQWLGGRCAFCGFFGALLLFCLLNEWVRQRGRYAFGRVRQRVRVLPPQPPIVLVYGPPPPDASPTEVAQSSSVNRNHA